MVARNLKGVHTHGDIAVCMVVGCERRAIYRSPAKSSRKAVHGYCAEHKALALTQKPRRYRITQDDYSTQSDWLIVCADRREG
jgi:hypothetical protein